MLRVHLQAAGSYQKLPTHTGEMMRVGSRRANSRRLGTAPVATVSPGVSLVGEANVSFKICVNV